MKRVTIFIALCLLVFTSFSINSSAQVENLAPGLYTQIGQEFFPLTYNSGVTQSYKSDYHDNYEDRRRFSFRGTTSGTEASDTFILVTDPNKQVVVRTMKRYAPFIKYLTPPDLAIVPLYIKNGKRFYDEKEDGSVFVTVPDGLRFKYDKIADNIFRIKVLQVKPGEYGFVFRMPGMADFELSAIYGFTLTENSADLAADTVGPQNLRILYWNIQNGMWSDQGNNYDNFVKYVNSVNPDICVWAEGKTHYKTGTAESFKATDDLYLTKHWPELAARYGHKYVYVGGERDFFPQVITSKFPIENVKRITGTDSLLVVHGCGWATIGINGKKFNFVTVHTWPQKYGFNIPTEDRERSKEAHEGDYFRRTEMEYICNETVNSHPQAGNEYWVMLGDFNSRSHVDNYHYKWADDDTRFLVHDYVREHTPYIDAVAEKFPGQFKKTIIGGGRIDFVYMTKPAFDCLKDINVIYDGFPANTRAEGLSNFCYPSDHYPIIMNLRVE